ncbi:MAG: HEAT repeat domain-containing protein [Paracoccaceae bacterium]
MPPDTFTEAEFAATQDGLNRFLMSENEVLRSAAIRALPHLLDAPGSARTLLVACLDEDDPDIRCDAMEALRPVATVEDADALRQSLARDPVREVKLAAIAALGRLRDEKSVPLLRALATSRAEDQVAWEDDTGDWDEWLDVQIAAIKALGDIGEDAAIDDLIDALFDAYGQNVDDFVFSAFGQLGERGLSVLVESFRQTKGVTKRRAALALAQIAPEAFAHHLDTLLAEDDPVIRRLGVQALPADDPRCTALAHADPEPSLRVLALQKAASVDPFCASAALSDADESVKAAALALMPPAQDPEAQQNRIDNLLVWFERAKPQLGQAILDILTCQAPDRALALIVDLLADRTRDLDLRVAGAKALGVLDVPLELIAEQLSNPARQVRAALLAVVRDRAAEDPAAEALAASVIDGTFNIASPPEEAGEVADPVDVATPKDGAGPNNIWITPDGDIVEHSAAANAEGGRSTLDEILAQATQAPNPPPMAEDTPEESGAKRAKRLPVEGSGDVQETLALDALRVFMPLTGEGVTRAVMSRIDDPDDQIRCAAWSALAQREVPEACVEMAERAAQDADPIIRMAVFRLRRAAGDVSAVGPALWDEDALIRAEAVGSLTALQALDFVSDARPPVRAAAASRMVESGETAVLSAALRAAMTAGFSDVIATLRRSGLAAEAMREALTRPGVSDREALILLRGLDG